MGRRVRLLSALAAGTLAFVVGTSTAHALLSTVQVKCQGAIGKEGAKFANGVLKLRQKCITANLGTAGTCAGPDAVALQKLRDKMRAGIAKTCTFPTNTPGNLAVIGFPGPCNDVNPVDGFTLTDLQDCIQSSHETLVGGTCGGGANAGQACSVVGDCPDSGPGTFCRGMLQFEYDISVVAGPLTGTALKCQKEIATNSGKVVAAILKNVQKCRNGLLTCKTDPDTLITTCKVSGVSAENCAVGDPKTAAAITKAKDKAAAAIAAKCSPTDVSTILACEPNQANGADTATCELAAHQALVDNPDATALSDLIDYEYAKHGLCGDNRVNQRSEECDGSADTACPGDCGGALGFFPCLCQDKPRTRVVEHANADLDNGWTGQSHDSGIVEGGGYVSDLWDCDGPGGPDTLCIVGPSCNLFPNQACSPAPNAAVNADTMCPGIGNFCRKTAGGATGRHCEIEFKKRCKTDIDCPTLGDHCLTIPHGAPLPLSSGGVAVCVVNNLTEDVVGTTDLATGQSSVRLRQDSITYTGGDQQQPCPVCGGFCSGNAGPFGPGNRNLCSSNADCTGPAICVTEAVCSWGPDKDKACNPNPPSGGPSEFFGNPSKDCRMDGTLLGNIDILFNPATTGATSLTANQPCHTAGFNNKRCVGGTSQGRICTVASECPGGSCNDQCFCNAPEAQQPSQCQAACLGGANDATPCTDDTDCDPPNGFCHPADCRVNPSDTGSSEEGICTVGPIGGHCSGQTFVNCNANSTCSNVQACVGGANDNAPCTTGSECPGGGCSAPPCPFCDPGETCNFAPQQCFAGPTIHRAGSPGTPDRTTAAIFCIAHTASAAVNSVAGLPGPGAITQPTTNIEVGF